MFETTEESMYEAKDVLKDYLHQEVQNDGGSVEVEEGDNLLANGIIDSLGVLKLVSFIEHQFNIQIPDEDVTIKNFRSLADIASYLEAKKQQK
jgi:acyl carrier protein